MKDSALFVRQLREVADWYEAHPDTPMPHEPTFDVRLYGLHTKHDARFLLRLLAPCRKKWDDDFLNIQKEFPSGATITGVFTRHEICTRRVVGTKVIPEHTVPEHTQDIIRWDCDPLLEAESTP